jgi:hypothetical protein
MYVKKTVLQAIALYFPNRKRKYYTEAEDKSLLKFIVQHERYKAARGEHLWKLMERKKALPGKGTLLIGMFMKIILVQ